MRDKIFYLACFGFAAGVLWRSLLLFDFRAAFFVGLVSLFLILFFSLISKRKFGILVSVFALAFSLGILRFELADKPAPEIFQSHIGQKVTFSGTIADQPVKKENGVEITVEAEEDRAKTKILLFTEKNDSYDYGDGIQFAGNLQKPTDFLTDQGKEFDYVNYLKKDGVLFVMRHPKIEMVSHGGGSFFKRALVTLRGKLVGALNSAIPEPESLLMRGLILGERASFGERLRQAFVATGLIHIVTVSGYHVALVADWIMKLFGFLPMAFSAVFGMSAVFLYVVMTGGAQTAIRAGIMAALALLARATGRMYDAGRALVLVGAIMIFANPFILAFDASFELSFLATVAVIFFAPKIETFFLWIKWKRLRGIMVLTSAVYMFIMPFILYKIGNLSLATLPANIAVLPVVPITMIMGFITGFAGLISNGLALIPGKIAFVLLRYELIAIGLFSRLPFASFSIPDFPFALVILVYAIFLRYLFAPPARLRFGPQTDQRFVLPMAAFLLTLFAAGFLAYRHYESNQIAQQKMQTLLSSASAGVPPRPFEPDLRTKSSGCVVRGLLPDRKCTPGDVFHDVTVEHICVKGYTQTVRNVSTELRKEVYAEYGVAYPQPRGAYEVDHLIPLALAGSNDIGNLWTETAEPTPGFHEKDLVEVYLQEEVCGGRVTLPVAQRQIATDWLAVYDNLTPEKIVALKKKYGRR